MPAVTASRCRHTASMCQPGMNSVLGWMMLQRLLHELVQAPLGPFLGCPVTNQFLLDASRTEADTGEPLLQLAGRQRHEVVAVGASQQTRRGRRSPCLLVLIGLRECRQVLTVLEGLPGRNEDLLKANLAFLGGFSGGGGPLSVRRNGASSPRMARRWAMHLLIWSRKRGSPYWLRTVFSEPGPGTRHRLGSWPTGTVSGNGPMRPRLHVPVVPACGARLPEPVRNCEFQCPAKLSRPASGHD